MITVENLSKAYGSEILFSQSGFKVNAKEHIGLVGRNGHGKTTLMRIIAREIEPDDGIVLTPKNYRLGYVQQHIEFTKDTVLNEGITGLRPDDQDNVWKVKRILSGLGFSEEDMDRHPSEFSGGYQVRLNLAKVLVSEPDMLLLDEPTNYLDIESIRWIERFLAAWPREFLLITHDRGFMDKVVTHTVGIHRRKIRKIAGTTEKYYVQIALDEEVYEKTRVNDEKRRKEVELFISRFRAKARLANMVQSRIKTLAKQEKQDKLEKIKELDFSFIAKPFEGKKLISIENLNFGYQSNSQIIQNFNLQVFPKDRICIVGKNGKGKTTLLKLLAGKLSTQQGIVTYHPGVVSGFFEQTNVSELVDDRTIEQELLYTHPNVDRQLARNICGAMMFEGDNGLKKIRALSGGEKSRVMLGKLLVTPVNLLFLDEPTNHLDMESCDALLSAMDNFDGALILVTHNEMFLHAIAKRLIVFKHGQIQVFEGTYNEFIEKQGWDDQFFPSNDSSGIQADKIEKNSKKVLRKKRSEIIAERSKILKPFEEELAELEKQIELKERELNDCQQEMQSATETNQVKRIIELSKSIVHCQQNSDRMFTRFVSLTEQYESIQLEFEKKLNAL
ncbi:MAG: ABC-F family ATP-binding cassette domain-containing protein [Desulfobacterales bacterium]|nr:ABC-F family ATP-binding cassette domain-containing protein [Desulfobacterales bacterium]